MDDSTITMTVVGIAITLINGLGLMILNDMKLSVRRQEDKYVEGVKEIYKRIDNDKKDAHDQREVDLKDQSSTQKKTDDDLHTVKSDIIRLNIHTAIPPK